MSDAEKRVTYQQIRISSGIGMNQVHKIFYGYLAVRKLCTRWILRNLSDAQKLRPINWCREMMQRFAWMTGMLCKTGLQAILDIKFETNHFVSLKAMANFPRHSGFIAFFNQIMNEMLKVCMIMRTLRRRVSRMWSLIILAGTAIALWLHWRYRNRHLLEFASRLPGPKPLPVIGNALYFMCQPEELINVIRKLIDSYGDVLRFWLGPDLNVIVTDPDDLKILLTSPKVSQKGPQYKYMANVLGGGILSGSGHAWRRHRKIALPNYGKRAIESYENLFHAEISYLLQKIGKIPKGQEYNIYVDIVNTTSYTVCLLYTDFRCTCSVVRWPPAARSPRTVSDDITLPYV
ncbi:Cytochrome P450 4g15 [Eumeta japonica]|uniref:Cytochrome P450 4g15 n=1 Tax=Eumeta variegata TaxID=151549 RepID=A0A4C1SF43_EUMVA|nr:Cytochrome P450 4g15 [Eumeta japonica]